MVVDTSAVLAILLEEPEAAEYAQLIEDDPAPLISAASVFEAGIVLISRHGLEARGDLRDFIEQGGLQVEPVTAEQAELALDAYQRFGKGRHRAGLNFGDCFALHCAKRRGNRCCSKARIFPRRILQPSLASVARMNTRSRSTRGRVRFDTVGRHGATKVEHASDSRGLTSDTMQVLSFLTIRGALWKRLIQQEVT
jgi:ribonuclease VapC